MVRRLLGVLALLLALGACGDDSSPQVDPPPPTTAPPTTAPPTVTPTPQPVVNTPEGVVRRWIELYNKLLTDGDGAEITKISSTCEPCLRTIRVVENIFRKHGFIHGGAYSIQALRVLGKRSGLVGVRADLLTQPTRYALSHGGKVMQIAGGPYSLRFDVRHESSGYVIDYETQVSK